MRDTVRTLFRPALALTVVLLAAFAFACGSDEEEAATTPTTEATQPAAAATTAAAAPTDSPAASDCPATGTAPEVQMKKYDKRPEMTIDPAKKYTATLKTVRGDITIELRPDLAPEHVNNFVFLAREHFYDGVTFHRVLAGFMAQAGDPTGTGSGGPGYTIPAEFNNEPFVRGVLGMARTPDPNSAGSQWFITLADARHLDKQYTVFGKVTAGMDVVDCITLRDPSRNPNAPAGDAIIGVDITEG